MKRHSAEIESTLLAMFAALPLYFTGPISVVATLFFHAVMLAILLGFRSERPFRLSPELLAMLGFAYLLFFPVDAFIISRSLIRASTNLLFFIAAYQGFESSSKDNQGQRLLVTFLIFITSIATSTHIATILFVILFAALTFRELMSYSRRRTIESTGETYQQVPRTRQAMAYVIPTLLIAAFFFPLLPRLRNPFVRGPSAIVSDQTTGITDSIDLSKAEYGSNDPGIVARIWMGVDALPFFTPIRLKAAVYDRYEEGEWTSSQGRAGQVWARDHVWLLGRAEGISTKMEIQQRPTDDRQIFLPVGTYAVEDVGPLYWGRGQDRVVTPLASTRNITYQAGVSQKLIPFEEPDLSPSGYPYSDRIVELATQVAGEATTPREVAAKVEVWMTRDFSYLPNSIDRDPMTLEQFLFEEHRGHCEFFAAGMVVLLGSLDIPARVVGGFYGGELNPLGRYFVVRRSDAHAWVEVFDGEAWVTYDPTPPDLRPGASSKVAILQYLSAIQDTVIYVWDRWILTYGQNDQIEALLAALQPSRDLISGLGLALREGELPRIPVWFLVLTIALVPALYLLHTLRTRRRGVFEQLSLHLERLGYPVERSATGKEILASLRSKNAAIAGIAAPILRYHELQRYSGRQPSTDLEKDARDALRILKER